MEIITLVKQNIRHKKGAFKSVLFLMCIITAVTSSIISNNENTHEALSNGLDEIKCGDFVAWTEHDYVDEVKKGLEKNNDVSSYWNEDSLAVNYQDINGNELKGQSYCVLKWNSKYHVFNENYDGFVDSPEPIKRGETYVPVALMNKYGCKIGSKIKVYTNFGNMTFTIKGFLQEPLMGAYTIGIKHYFLCDEDFSELTKRADIKKGRSLVCRQSVFHIFENENSNQTLAEFKKSVNSTSKIMDYSFFTETRKGMIKYTTSYPDICSGILYSFIVMLFVIVIVIIAHGISSGIETDYSDLGVLKANGFTNGKIRLVYIAQYLLAVGIGAALGIALSIPLTIVIGKLYLPLTGILAPVRVSFGVVIIPISIMIGIVLVSVLLFTWKIGKISPVRAITGGKPPVYFASHLMCPINSKVLGISIAFRQFISDKKRYLGTIIISGILVFFMISISILANCTKSEKFMESMGIVVFDVNVSITKPLKTEQITEIKNDIEKESPTKQMQTYSSEYVTMNGSNIFCLVYDEESLFENTLVKGRVPKYDNEIVITEIVADEYNIHIGDKVTISTKKGSAEYIISGYFQSTYDMGVCIGMGYAAYNKIGQNYLGILSFTLNNKADGKKVVQMFNNKYKGVVEAEVLDGDDMIDMIQTTLSGIAIMIYIISIIFGLVTVSMICSKSFLKERTDIGIFKAVGFSVPQLRFQFALRFLIVSLLGAILGIIMSLSCSSLLIEYLLRYMGITSFVMDFTPVVLLLPVFVLCLCFFLFSYLSSRKVKKVSTKELVTE